MRKPSVKSATSVLFKDFNLGQDIKNSLERLKIHTPTPIQVVLEYIYHIDSNC